MNPQPLIKQQKDDRYGRFVRTKPCSLPIDQFPHFCLANPIEAHHVSPRNGTRGMGLRAGDDRRSVPVCQNAHRYCERYPLAVLPFLNEVIRKLNAEFDQLYPEPRKTREKKPRRIIKKVKGWAYVLHGNILDCGIGSYSGRRPKSDEAEIMEAEIKVKQR